MSSSFAHLGIIHGIPHLLSGEGTEQADHHAAHAADHLEVARNQKTKLVNLLQKRMLWNKMPQMLL